MPNAIETLFISADLQGALKATIGAGVDVDSSSIWKNMQVSIPYYLDANWHMNQFNCTAISYCLPYIFHIVLVHLRFHSECLNGLSLRKVFSLKRYESVKELQYFCGELQFGYIYDFATWNFYTKLIFESNTNVNVSYNVMITYKMYIFCTKMWN